MYAVIETGGKQYRVELGSELAIERLDGAPGDTISFERVLLVADSGTATVGTPIVADALVSAQVVRQDRGEKVIVFKYRPKARHRAKKGHRQEQTVIRVADIRFNGRSAADEVSAQQKEESKARRAATAEAERKAATDRALAAKLEQEAAARSEEAAAQAGSKAAPKPARGTVKPAGSGTAATKKTAGSSAAAKTAAKVAPKTTTRVRTPAKKKDE